MFRDVIAPATTVDQWHTIRQTIETRILGSMGTFPLLHLEPACEVLDEWTEEELRFQHIRYRSLPEWHTYGTWVLPRESGKGQKRPAVLCLHGTDPQLAHRNVISPNEKPHRQYGIELAKRGFITLAVDQFGYGQGNRNRPQDQVFDDFYREYPHWSLDGVRLWIHQRAIDLLATHPCVDANRLGCIGHSLGGRAAAYLAAFEPRMKASVPSAGISPNLTNVFRHPPTKNGFSPILNIETAKTGKPLFEYQELLALIAPRSVLILEPWNDPYNPMIEPVFRCFEKARFVFELCQASAGLQLLTHGDGHDTQPTIRQYAYQWLEKCLA